MAGTLTATITPLILLPAAATFTGSGALVTSIAPTYTVPVALAGSGALTAPTYPAFASSPALAGSGALSATGSQKYAPAPAFAGGGALTATVTQAPIPTITNITTSPFHVGDTITLTGTGFVVGTSGAVTVTVGGTAATSVTVGSSTSLTCVVPSVALGAQNVVVTAASGASSPFSITLVTANVPVAIIGTPTVGGTSTTSIALPAHAVGDLIIIAAGRPSNTLGTKPTASGTVPAWIDIDAAATSAGLGSIRTAYFVATATNHTSGTWTSYQAMCAIVLRGQKAASPIGGHAAVGSSGTPAAPAVTLGKTDGSSILLHIFAEPMAFSSWGTPPAGYTKIASSTGSTGTNLDICVDAKNVTTSDGAMTQPAGTGGTSAAATIEILD